jgi:hypothetical protein
MIPPIPPGLREAILAFVNPALGTRRSLAPPPRIDRDVELSLTNFRVARADTEDVAYPFYAATFRDEDDDNQILDVVVAPLIRGPQITRLLTDLQHSQVPVRTVSAHEAENIVVDRAAEFIAARSGGGGGRGSASGRTTVIDSNRTGDTIVYCNGYFVSTATAFGVSTPATKAIPKGRYTFGIVQADGSHRFDRTLWTCPARVRLPLP